MMHIYRERGYKGKIGSAGTADWNAGAPADGRAIAVALENGIDIRAHRARQIQPEDFLRFDLIVVMDKSNHEVVRRLAPESARGKVRMLLAGSDNPAGGVPDPYHGDASAFTAAFAIIEHGCLALAAELASNRPPAAT